MPVMMPDRHGAHTPAVVKQFVYLTPSLANWSMLGVIACGSPKQLMWGLMSSQEIQRIFGGFAGSAPVAWELPQHRENTLRIASISVLAVFMFG
tara:strand:- start:260 stop:541 length:282 start_codon:yes stop_codon:yes gene_type:complete